MQIAKQRSLFYVQIPVHTRGAPSSGGCMEKSHKKSLMIKNSDLIDLRGRVSMREYTDWCSWCTLNCCKDVNEGKTLWFKFKCKAALLKVESEMLRDMPCLLLLMAPPAAEAPSWSSDPESDPEFDDPVEAGNDDCPDDGGGIDEVACKACNRGCWWCPAPRGAAECNNGIGRCTDPEAGRDKGEGMSSKASRSSSSSSVSTVAMAAILTSALLLWLLIMANSSRMASSSALASPLTEPEDFLAASLVDSWSLIKELGGRFLLGWFIRMTTTYKNYFWTKLGLVFGWPWHLFTLRCCPDRERGEDRRPLSCFHIMVISLF